MSSKQSSINSNVVNVGELIERISTFGVKFNPVRNDFTIPFLTELKTNAETLVGLAKTAENIDKNSIAVRASGIKSIDGLVTRAINSFSISGASPQSVQQAESKVRTFRNIRVSAKPTAEELAAAKADGKELRVNALHNASYDRKIENFADIIDFVKNSSEYGPNEADISVNGLTHKLKEIKTQNNTCLRTAAELDATRMERDTMLCADVTGLVDVAMGAKKYVKSVYGANSPQYKSISDLRFRKTKKITTLDTVDIPAPER